jgi:hypothetical protein
MMKNSILVLGFLVAISMGSTAAIAANHEADEASSTASGAADEVAEANSEASAEAVCFDLNRVKTTRVIDRETVLVTMRGNDQYTIKTVNRCSGLTKNSGVIFDIRGASRRVCPIDSIKGSVTSTMSRGTIVTCPIDTIEKVVQAVEEPAI